MPLDPLGLALAVGFVAFGMSLIPLNNWLDRRDARRRNQPQPWRRQRRGR